MSDLDPTEDNSVSHLATLANLYLPGEFKWEFDGQWWPIRIGAPAPALDAAFPDAPRFGMVTASNPGFVLRDDDVNRLADRALQLTLERRGLLHRAGYETAQNRTWKAYSWLVIGPDEADFDAISREFGQIGTLLWPRGQAVRLRMQATRPQDMPTHPYIDWVDPPPARPID